MPQRRQGWISADVSGLPVYPGLIKLKEAKADLIDHTIRVTSPTQAALGYVSPASAAALFPTSLSAVTSSVPLGTRLRLKRAFNCMAQDPKTSAFKLKTSLGRAICTAMKKYGLILAADPSAASTPPPSLQLSGEANAGWAKVVSQATLQADLRLFKASDLEVVVAPGVGKCCALLLLVVEH
jgi:hypothetical protein